MNVIDSIHEDIAIVLLPGGIIRHTPWADSHESTIRALGLGNSGVGAGRRYLRAGAVGGDMAYYYADKKDPRHLPTWYTEHEAEYRDGLAELIPRVNALKARLMALDADRRSRSRELRADYLASSNALYAEYMSKYDAMDDDYEAKSEALDAKYAPEYTILTPDQAPDPPDLAPDPVGGGGGGQELTPEEIADALRAEYRAKRAALYADYRAESDALYDWYEAQRAPLYTRYNAQDDALCADFTAKRDALYTEYLSLPGAMRFKDWPPI